MDGALKEVLADVTLKTTEDVEQEVISQVFLAPLSPAVESKSKWKKGVFCFCVFLF